MADANDVLVVFVHGWSVTHTDTYGGLPRRLAAEATGAGLSIRVEEIHLGKYISFHDEVRVRDIARAFEAAVDRQLRPLLGGGRRFVCITHSTGGPVVREWWRRYYVDPAGSGRCPMSHLVMLAPANYGSALAQLGKGRLGRMKSWLGGVEPGAGVLDWLELGSAEAWALNEDWIRGGGDRIGGRGVFPFVLTGQSIDRHFYDHLNSYTGEIGSDGVVRVAAANLRGRYIRLAQQAPDADGRIEAPALGVEEYVEAPESGLRILAGKSHSGATMGIMRSVHKGGNDPKSADTVKAILDAIRVRTMPQYAALCRRWSLETDAVQSEERLEREDRLFRDRFFIHDRFSMVVFRVRDDHDFPVYDFDLVLTAGEDGDPNHLPVGFLGDRQRNRIHAETITYYFNHDLMTGTEAVVDPEDGDVIREKRPGTTALGLRVVPRPQEGFVHYLPCEIRASGEMLDKALAPNTTTLIDIRLRRLVHSNTFAVEPLRKAENTSFKNEPPSDRVVP